MKNKMILILGGSSYIGRQLYGRLGSERSIATYNFHPINNGIHFDALTMRPEDVVEEPERFSHAIILLGETDPESCAADPIRSQALNVESLKKIIGFLAVHQVKPVFFSTEFVFDGEKGNYAENDRVNPILLYGRQKLAIESYLQANCEEYLIIRLAKTYGDQPGDGTLFTNWLAKLGAETLPCAADQIFSPVIVGDVVAATLALINGGQSGIFHLAGPRAYKRIELLELLIAEAKKYLPIKTEIVPCSIHSFKLREKRPLDVSMVPDKLVEATGVKLTDVAMVCKKLAKTMAETAEVSL